MVPSSNGKPVGQMGRQQTAKQLVRIKSKNIGQHQNAGSSPREEMKLVHMRTVFRIYHDIFTGGNLALSKIDQITNAISDVWDTRKEGTGKMRIQMVARYLQHTLESGWMAPNSPQRMELEQELRVSSDRRTETTDHGSDMSPQTETSFTPIPIPMPIPAPVAVLRNRTSNKRVIVHSSEELGRGYYNTIPTIPVHFEPSLQYEGLKAVQEVLEKSVHRWFKMWVPQVLEREGLNDPAEGELNLYRVILSEHVVYKRSSQGHKKILRQCFERATFTRHAAVHRDKEKSVLVIEAKMQNAVELTTAICDVTATATLRPWYDEVKRLAQDARQKYSERQVSQYAVLVKDDTQTSETQANREEAPEATRLNADRLELEYGQWNQAQDPEVDTKSVVISDADSLLFRQLLWDYATATRGPRPCGTSSNLPSNMASIEYTKLENGLEHALENNSMVTFSPFSRSGSADSLEGDMKSKVDSEVDSAFDESPASDIDKRSENELASASDKSITDSDDRLSNRIEDLIPRSLKRVRDTDYSSHPAGGEDGGDEERPNKCLCMDDREYNAFMDQAVQDDIRAAIYKEEHQVIFGEGNPSSTSSPSAMEPISASGKDLESSFVKEGIMVKSTSASAVKNTRSVEHGGSAAD